MVFKSCLTKNSMMTFHKYILGFVIIVILFFFFFFLLTCASHNGI